MKWWTYLYKGRKAGLAGDRLLGKIEKGGFLPEVYVITAGRTGHHLLDIHPAMLLREKEREDALILGVALGYGEAAETVRQMVEDMVRTTGGFQWEVYMRRLEGEKEAAQAGE